jgi:DNA-binding CsgD family transcriptional regulator
MTKLPLGTYPRLIDQAANNSAYQAVDLATNERYSEFELKIDNSLESCNELASELLLNKSLFEVKDNQLMPIVAAEKTQWLKAIANVWLKQTPTVLFINGIGTKIPVLVQPKLGRINIRLQTADMIAPDTFAVACNSLRITAAEQTVLQMLLRGSPPKAIVKLTNRTESTVRSHIKSLFSKTGSTCMQELIILFLRMPSLVN